MPRKVRPGTTPLLAYVPDEVHAQADARRRRERVTWGRLVTELLRRWAAGDDAALAKPVKLARPATPEAEEAQRHHDHLMATNDAYRKALTERVDPTKLRWHNSLGALLAAQAEREGRAVDPAALANLADDGEESGNG